MLIKSSKELKVDLSDLTSKSDINLENDISELLDDQLFEDLDILGPEVKDLVSSNPKIARALINKPEIIIADQPENFLDNSTVKKVFFLFESLNKQGTTIIITSNLEKIITVDYKTINLDQ